MKPIIFALAFCTLLGTAFSLTCSARWQCTSVSDNYNYVDCIGGVCTCLKDLGFAGNATVEGKCSCPSPKYVTWKNGDPFCASLESCVAADNVHQREALLRSKVDRIYQNLIGITSVLIAAGAISVDDLFNPIARGRITPVGNFNNLILQQYFYVLAAGGNVSNVWMINNIAQGNIVSVRVDIEFTPPSGFPAPKYNLTQTGFFYFDSSDRVAAADLNILNLGAIVDPPAFLQPAFIQNLCATIAGNPSTGAPGSCNGANTQYASFSDCVTFMNSIPYGSYNRANSNTVVCRQIHSIMTVLAPTATGANVHCPHVGPTGGGACVDFPVSDFWQNDVLPFSS